MEICNATGNGICINCNGTPPKNHGEICRKTVQDIIDAITEYGDVVVYNYATNKFYSSHLWDGDTFDKSDDD